MNWQKLLAVLGAALTAGGQSVSGIPGWVMTGLGGVALYLARPSQTLKVAEKISDAIPGRKPEPPVIFPEATP